MKTYSEFSIAKASGIATALRCPDCVRGIIYDGSSLLCETCNISYPIFDGIPILLSHRSPFAGKSLETWRQEMSNINNWSKYRARRLLPRTTPYDLGRCHYDKVVNAVSDGHVALNLASGRTPRPSGQWVNVDIKFSANVDIIADAHFLPFADNTFRAIVCVNSLEYFKWPWQAASEIVRVLAPGGMLYVNTPFVMPYCGDRYRFHSSALRELFANLEIYGPYATAGPVRTIARLAEQAARELLPWKPASFLLSWLVAWCLHPLKYLDLLILSENNSEWLGTSFCIVAVKPACR